MIFHGIRTSITKCDFSGGGGGELVPLSPSGITHVSSVVLALLADIVK